MKTIWKYRLKLVKEQIVEMPIDAEILCVQIQDTNPCIWVLVNSDNTKGNRKIRIVGTGHYLHLHYQGKYIGTFQIYTEDEIYHVFDEDYINT